MARGENMRVSTSPGRPRLLSANTRQRDDPCYHAHLSPENPGAGRHGSPTEQMEKKLLPASSRAWKLELVGGALQPAGGATGGISRVQPAHGASGCFSAALVSLQFLM